MVRVPETRYAKSGGTHIAYSVNGRGDFDIVVVPGWVSHLELQWEDEPYRRFMERLGSFARVIRFDKRNMGLSDRTGDTMPPLEDRMDDVRAVMDAAGSERAALMGISEGGALAVMFAASYPERVTALVLAGAGARLIRAPDYPHGAPPEAHAKLLALVEQGWGTGVLLPLMYPEGAEPSVEEWWARFERMAASPGAAICTAKMAAELDVRPLLPVLRMPTLVIHRQADRMVRPANGRYLAEHIPGARYAGSAGAEHWLWLGNGAESDLGEIEEFLTGSRRHYEPDRVLATVLFTDIVGSTERAAELGDQRWGAILDEHDRLVRRELTRFRGREIKATGDGFLATFDGPARAIRCAAAIRDGMKPVGLEVRSGLHTGEVELRDGDVGGIAVHIGARIASLAGAGEVLVSSTVKDIVAGAGIDFADRGEHGLKGVPGEWRLFSVAGVG